MRRRNVPFISELELLMVILVRATATCLAAILTAMDLRASQGTPYALRADGNEEATREYACEFHLACNDAANEQGGSIHTDCG
jgi:hypothetical protein